MTDQPRFDDGENVASREESPAPRSKPEIALQAARDLIKAIDSFTLWAENARIVPGIDPTNGNSARKLGKNALLTLAKLEIADSPFDDPNRHLHLWPPSPEENIDPEWYSSPERPIQDMIVSGLSYLNIVLKPAAEQLIESLEYSPEAVFANGEHASEETEKREGQPDPSSKNSHGKGKPNKKQVDGKRKRRKKGETGLNLTDAEQKMAGAIRSWHEYDAEDRSVGIMEWITYDELAMRADCSRGLLGKFFNKWLGKNGNDTYKRLCKSGEPLSLWYEIARLSPLDFPPQTPSLTSESEGGYYDPEPELD